MGFVRPTFLPLAVVLTVSRTSVADVPVKWDSRLYTDVPKVYEAAEYGTNGVRAIFYENVPFRGKETRVFAYLAVPETADGRPVPGVVLVHGGGGSAFSRWVRYWNDRGYAALSFDWNGCVSGSVRGNENSGHFTHAWAGPRGAETWRSANEPIADQWPYHAVAAIIRANTLLGSLPGVDAGRVGLTGVSWGGFLTCIAAGVDSRFRFAAPVYGCGYIIEHSMWRDAKRGVFGKCPAELLSRYEALWDPRHYLPNATLPFLFIDGTNDLAFPLDILEKSRRLVPTEVTRCLIPRLEHTHGPVSECPSEVFAYADGVLRRGEGLPRCSRFCVVSEGSDACEAVFDMRGDSIEEAFLHYTLDGGESRDREWKVVSASFAGERVRAELPERATGIFISVKTRRALTVSSNALLWGDPLGCAGKQETMDGGLKP